MLFRKILFWIKYKKIKTVSTVRYNEAIKYMKDLDVTSIHSYMNGDDIRDTKKLNSIYTQIGEHNIITKIGACAIEPRFKKWSLDDYDEYCNDIEKDVNKAFYLCGFFLSNFGLKQPILATFFLNLAKIKT